ncbi:hypothetical protein [Microcystis sp. M113S1]|uniref:hypothetical protein n=1 Tax=Microcystis sp. M113S1 TaxID=2771104 RepID=UPI00258DBA47|nr:hypothetical protein [Microcystis sp. M113S1]
MGLGFKNPTKEDSYLKSATPDFLQSQGLSEAEEDRGDRSQQRNLQANLLSRFQAPAVDTTERAHAGLCLRCYVSEPILNACRKIDHLFGDDRSFT